MVRLILTLMLLLSFSAAAEQPQAHQEQALLWRITSSQQTKASYLFGTIHSEDVRVLNLPPAVEQAFNGSPRFIMEIVPDAAASQRISQRMMLPDDKTLSSLLDAKLYGQARQALVQHGVPAEAVERMKPWVLTMILTMPKPKNGHFLDQVLYEKAQHSHKRTGALETVDEQIDAFDGMTMAVQIDLLRDALAHYQEIPADTELLIKAWLRRDLVEMQLISDESDKDLPEGIAQQVQSRLVDARNVRMAERMMPLVKQGGVFVAVGALHLPGKNGLIALLRQRGFMVRPVY